MRIDKEKKVNKNYRWIITTICLAFTISFVFGFGAETVLPNTNDLLGVLLITLFIILGIFFDIIGVAITACDEEPFHAMSSRKVKGSKMAVKMLKNASKVSSFCNDIIGDICGIISGSAGVIMATRISTSIDINPIWISLLVTSLISALTIGGKAIGKNYAVKNSNEIIFKICKALSVFS